MYEQSLRTGLRAELLSGSYWEERALGRDGALFLLFVF